MDTRHWTLVAAIVFAHLTVNLSVASILESFDDVMHAITFGWCIGQLNLIAIWAALSPGRLIVRLPWAIFLAIVLWYTILASFLLRSGFVDRSDALLLGFTLSFGVIATQGPLWILAKFFDWRLLTPNLSSSDLPSADRQFSIRQLLFGMVLVCCALGLGRAILPPGELTSAGFNWRLLTVLIVAACVNLIVAVPCIWIAFARNPVLWAFAWTIYVFLFTVIQIGVLSLAIGPPGGNRNVFLEVWILNLAQCACIFGTLLILRAAGFRLHRRTTLKEREPQEWLHPAELPSSPFAENAAADSDAAVDRRQDTL